MPATPDVLFKDLEQLKDALPNGSSISLAAVLRFTSLAEQIKNDIILVQQGNYDPTTPPNHLSTAIIKFLASSCNISEVDVPIYWDTLKVAIWTTSVHSQFNDLGRYFQSYGYKHGIYSDAIYPLNQMCMTTGCSNRKKLMEVTQRPAILYTLSRGPIATYSVSLHCNLCRVSFHNTYYVDYGVEKCDRMRTYYGNIPPILHVGGHQYVEVDLARLWRMQSVLAWISMSNCARLYNMALSKDMTPPAGFPFQFELSGDHVWSAVVQISLIEDLALHDEVLAVPHGGEHKDRFTTAIKACNFRVQLYGQEELRHYCGKCTNLHFDENGTLSRKFSVVVTDGVTVGHPCCAVHNCHEPLLNNRDRFCAQHLSLRNICTIVGCERTVVFPTKTCDVANHKAVEDAYTLRGQSRFQLLARLQHAHLSNPTNSLPEVSEGPLELSNLDDNEDFDCEVPQDSEQPMGATTSSGNKKSMPEKKLRARFTRRRTHNEQLIVAPCGIILARETFYGAEGVATIVEMIKHTFHDDSIKPNHIFYDNNCTLSYMVRDDPYFSNIGLSVDVFHFKCKHSTEDEWCQKNCNPAAFEDLVGDNGGWRFNSSVAEQTNVWFGGFQSICRDMLAERYAFFLDEMILQKNQLTHEKLENGGYKPMRWPITK